MSQHTFYVEDEWHCETVESYDSYSQALDAIQQLALLAWNEPPNRAPCSSWETCGRLYSIVEYDTAASQQIASTPIVEIDAKGTRWLIPQPVKI